MDELPIVYRDLFIFCDITGRPVLARQKNGKVVHRYPADGYRIAQLAKDLLLLLSAGGSRLECFSLNDRTTWGDTRPVAFVGAARR